MMGYAAIIVSAVSQNDLKAVYMMGIDTFPKSIYGNERHKW
jgi:hypothetical protein